MDELKAAAERILIASKDPSAGVWVWGDASFGDCALRCDMEILARHYLSPPAAGPAMSTLPEPGFVQVLRSQLAARDRELADLREAVDEILKTDPMMIESRRGTFWKNLKTLRLARHAPTNKETE